MPHWAQTIIAVIVLMTLSMIGIGIFWLYGGAGGQDCGSARRCGPGNDDAEGIGTALLSRLIDYLFEEAGLEHFCNWCSPSELGRAE